MTNQLEVSNLINPIVNGFKLLSDEWNNLFDIGLLDYLHSQTEKYYFTNTFIHRSEKVRFNDIYYPVKAKYKNFYTDFNNLEEVFDEYKKITVVGSAGSGKTTLIKHIFLRSIYEQKRIPVLIELRYLNEYNGDFERLITEKTLKSKIKPSDIIFKRALESGKFLFLLDGYDEIFSLKKQETNRQIDLFIDSYSENVFIISTRPGSGIEGFYRFNDFQVCGLNNKDIEGFITKIVDNEDRKSRILKNIKESNNVSYREYLKNPLLLSMFILAFESHPEIPTKKSAFYRNVFDTFYSKHDGITKNSFPREKLTKLQRDDFEHILCIFSYLTIYEGKYAFTLENLFDVLSKIKKSLSEDYNIENLIYDFRTSISILILDGFEYSFPHRSMQEYFTALFISKLPSQKKQQAYNNLFEVLINSSTDNSFNLWSLCIELDELAFTSYFLIPNLENFKNQLESKDGKELVRTLFELIGAELQSNIITQTRRDERKSVQHFRIIGDYNFFNPFMEFCSVYDYDDIYTFPSKKNINEYIIAIKNKNLPIHKEDNYISVNQFYKIVDNKEVFELLIKNNIADLAYEIRQKIKNKIDELKESILRKNKSIDNLLNL